MKLKQCVTASITICVIMGSISGCSTKEGGNNILEEYTVEEHQTEETVEENDIRQEEQILQTITITGDFSESFQSIQGCAVIFDPQNNVYTFYHEDECKTRVSPDSTFKVVSALSGLHNQVVVDADSKMEYDGTNYPVDAWNQDLTMAEALKSSCVWYFRKVIDAVGQEKIQEELNSLAYGNCDISEWKGSGVNPYLELNGFWLDSSLLISPAEQVEVLRNIVEGKTIYTEAEVEILKSMMLAASGDSGKIYGKTGTGTNGTAWFIGFVENENANLYFAVYLDDDSSNEVNGAKAQEIALDILGKEI